MGVRKQAFKGGGTEHDRTGREQQDKTNLSLSLSLKEEDGRTSRIRIEHIGHGNGN
jgi:hypothetical protein